MNYVKTIVCFANSRKTSGRCIAGKEWIEDTPGPWVRPVSARHSHEVSEEDRRYQDGRDPQLLDIISVPCDVHQPVSHQNENHLIDANYYWGYVGRINWVDLERCCDQPKQLWTIGQSSYSGRNNRVTEGQEDGSSLFLIKTDNVQLLVGPKAPEYPDSKRGVRASFQYCGTPYLMDVTDPFIEREFLSQPDGTYVISNPYLCISLGDIYQGFFYKLVAGVLYRERFV